MDGRGRWLDNVFIERLWRSLKYECVYLHAFETGIEARAGIGRWIGYYNTERPHSALAGRTPDEAYAIDMERGEIGGVIKPRIHLSQAAKLSRKPGPPLFQATLRHEMLPEARATRRPLGKSNFLKCKIAKQKVAASRSFAD